MSQSSGRYVVDIAKYGNLDASLAAGEDREEDTLAILFAPAANRAAAYNFDAELVAGKVVQVGLTSLGSDGACPVANRLAASRNPSTPRL